MVRIMIISPMMLARRDDHELKLDDDDRDDDSTLHGHGLGHSDDNDDIGR